MRYAVDVLQEPAIRSSIPVHVSVEDGDECIIYKESDMVYGRPYVVEWMEGPVALVRTRDGIDILEPDPRSNG